MINDDGENDDAEVSRVEGNQYDGTWLSKWSRLNRYLRHAMYSLWYLIAIAVGIVMALLSVAMLVGATGGFVDYIIQLLTVIA